MTRSRTSHPGHAWDRRSILKASAAALAWPLLSPPRSAFARRAIKLASFPFTLGVASGEPAPDGFVLWTRLAVDPLNGGGMPKENIEVAWQVANDEGMTQVVARGTAVTTPDLAHSVHVEVAGLKPDRWYWYQFSAAGEVSMKGQARTLPTADAMPDKLRFAFASCQHYESGLFTAYRHMAAEPLDLIAHLGDYIYEGSAKDGQVRKHVGPELHTLEHYRNRHAQYKTDPLLQAAHAKCPWLVTWDDHEFANNYAGLISERTRDVPAEFAARRAAAYQAYYEHMPLRAAQIPSGPNLKLYRRVSFGRLADFSVLDTRQYRTDQPCGDGNKPPCDATFDPKATLLGAEQEHWLLDGLSKTNATWNCLTQQVMFARVDRLPGETIGYSMDQWPGYEANRQRLLKFFGEWPQLNPVVITGDIHSNWANNLQTDERNEKSPIVATEFVGTSISSGGNGNNITDYGKQLLAENPCVKYYNSERGYVACELTPTKWTSHYRTVPFVNQPDAPLNTRRSFVVEANRPMVHDA